MNLQSSITELKGIGEDFAAFCEGWHTYSIGSAGILSKRL